MKKSNYFLLTIAYILSIIAFVISIYFLYITCIKISTYQMVETEIFNQIKNSLGDLTTGTIGICLSFASTLFLFITFTEQRKQFIETQTNANKERFENTFFNLLSMLYQVRENINKEISICTKGEMNTLIEYYNGFRITFNKKSSTKTYNEIKEYLIKKDINIVELENVNDYLANLYEEYICEYKCNLGYYYRYIFNMINFVIEQWECDKNKEIQIHKYLNFIQAQMSNEELALIFYNVISHYGLDKNYKYQFKDKIDKYGFLENIDERTLLDRAHHIIFKKTKFRFLNRDETKKKEV